MRETAIFKLRTILLPVDFSPGNLSAAFRAGIVARRFNATVILLHVNYVPAWSSPPILPENDSARDQLEKFGVDELKRVVLKHVIRSGEPAKIIVDFAHDENCDLILLPIHGQGPIRRFLLGSVTAKVLDSATCPVGTLPKPEEASKRVTVSRVLCAVNFSTDSSRALLWAAAFASCFDALLTVAYVPESMPREVPEQYRREWDEGALAGMEARLRNFVQESGVRAQIVVGRGETSTTLANIARVEKADLLVIGRKSEANGRVGRNVYAIVRHASCPVVSV
jgi:nucleotide-binding universal stress UspA family protein